MPKPGFGVKLTEHERDVLAVYRDECGSYEKMIKRHDLPMTVVTCCRALKGHAMDPVKTVLPLKQLYDRLLDEDPAIIRRTHDVVKMRPGPDERRIGRLIPQNIPVEPDARSKMERLLVSTGYTNREARREVDRLMGRHATETLKGGYVKGY